MTNFALHPQLIQDCLGVGDLPLCRVLLMNNRLFPWLVLVPRVENASELFDLSASERAELTEEIASTSQALRDLVKADKMNVAALGNQVPQLHIHIVARFREDAAWPNPVWGGGAEPYDALDADEMLMALKLRLRLVAQV